MSILSQVINGKMTPLQGWSQGWAYLTSLVTKAEQSDPALASAINTAITDGKAALVTAESWAGTVISNDLANFADEVASLVVKYAPTLLGSASPLEKAGITVLQALTQVGQAAIQHEVTSFQAVAAPAPQPSATSGAALSTAVPQTIKPGS